MKELRRASIGLTLILAFAGLVLTGCSGAQTKADADPAACVAPGKLEQILSPEVELTELTCAFKKWEGTETLHFTVGVKNISAQPQRYKVNIFLDNGKGVGGLIPRTTKKGLVDPGKTESFVYPVPAMPAKPKAITLKISTLSE